MRLSIAINVAENAAPSKQSLGCYLSHIRFGEKC